MYHYDFWWVRTYKMQGRRGRGRRDYLQNLACGPASGLTSGAKKEKWLVPSFGLRVALGLRKKEISHSSDKPSKGKLFEQGTSLALRVLAL